MFSLPSPSHLYNVCYVLYKTSHLLISRCSHAVTAKKCKNLEVQLMVSSTNCSNPSKWHYPLHLLAVRKLVDGLIKTAFYFSVLGVSVRSYIELPFYTKYLLIAAYLASYNPAHTDRRFFTKQGRRGISNRAKAAAKGKKSNTQLTGTTVYMGAA